MICRVFKTGELGGKMADNTNDQDEKNETLETKNGSEIKKTNYENDRHAIQTAERTVKTLFLLTVIAWVVVAILFVVNMIANIELLYTIIAIMLFPAIGVTIAFVSKKTKLAKAQFDFKLKRAGFVADKEIEINKFRFLADRKSKRFIVVQKNEFGKIYDFANVLSYEIKEDGESVVKGSAGRALIGGLFFGVTGAIIGSSGKRKISNYCTDLRLFIRLNDFEDPLIDMQVINFQTAKSGTIYQEYKKRLQEVCAYLELMINNRTLEESAKANSIAEEIKPGKEEAKSIKAQLNELKELLAGGFITEEEYNNKRKEILK